MRPDPWTYRPARACSLCGRLRPWAAGRQRSTLIHSSGRPKGCSTLHRPDRARLPGGLNSEVIAIWGKIRGALRPQGPDSPEPTLHGEPEGALHRIGCVAKLRREPRGSEERNPGRVPTQSEVLPRQPDERSWCSLYLSSGDSRSELLAADGRHPHFGTCPRRPVQARLSQKRFDRVKRNMLIVCVF